MGVAIIFSTNLQQLHVRFMDVNRNRQPHVLDCDQQPMFIVLGAHQHAGRPLEWPLLN